MWGDRYHRRELTTPSEVRNVLVYVLNNHLKHGEYDVGLVDPCSSAPWFDGLDAPPRAEASRPTRRAPALDLAPRQGLVDRRASATSTWARSRALPSRHQHHAPATPRPLARAATAPAPSPGAAAEPLHAFDERRERRLVTREVLLLVGILREVVELEATTRHVDQLRPR